MRILYCTQFFPPENTAAAFRASEHAVHWHELGNEITVFTGYPNSPMGKIFEDYEVRQFEKVDYKGIPVVRSRLTARPNKNLFNRLQNMLSFLVFGSVNAFVKREEIGEAFDVVVASSGPVFTGCLGLLFSRVYKAPLVLEFRDVTFEQLVATGKSRDSCSVQCVRALELWLAGRADKVIALTGGFKALLVQNGVSESKINVFYNGADCETRASVASRLGLVAGYYGTMGISQDVPETLNCLSGVQDIVSDFEYIMIGEGAARGAVEKTLASGSYPFACLLPGMSQEDLEAYYSITDIAIVSLQNSASFKYTLPSKILQSFARGIPVFFFGPEGEAANLIRDSHAGLVLTGTKQENEKSIRLFFSQGDWREALNAMSVNAFKLASENFSRTVIAEKELAAIADLVNDGR